MNVKKEILKDLVNYENVPGYGIVVDVIKDTSRWSTHYRLVFSHGGKFFETEYSRAATESQCEMPFDYADDEIECKEVRPVQKTFTVYE